jgi:hypothetical protein
MAGKLLSVKQAADYMGMSQAWLFASGIPCIKLGRRRLYRVEDLDGFADKRRRK